MNVDLSSALSSLGSGTSSSDRRGIADNFDTFLTLLTTQLQNQNPLDPLDTNQFTQQLVQFTTVEQSIKTNQHLENLAKLSAANTLTSLVSYIGKSVTVDGDSAQLSNGSATWSYSAESASSAATFVVKDAQGNEVYSETRSIPGGTDTFSWDGRGNNGIPAPTGTYQLSITAAGTGGGTINVSTRTTGTVSGVDMTGAEPVLIINGREVKFDQILSVLEQSSP